MSPAVLFDPAKRVTTQDVAAMVDRARAQSANPRHTGQPGRRNFGVGEEVWLAWNDAGDAPVILPGGGIAVLAAADPDARVGVARDSASGAYLAWDMEDGAPWPDAQGNPISVPADLVASHREADGASPLTLATMLVVEEELRAFAEADEQTLPGRLAGLNALLSEIEQSDHPLFDLLQPYVDAVQAMVPQVAGAARWSRISERRAAGQILDQFLRLIHIGLDDPARLHEIIDSNRAVALRDRTRGEGGEANAVSPDAVIDAPSERTTMLDGPIQLADSGMIMTDAHEPRVPWLSRNGVDAFTAQDFDAEGAVGEMPFSGQQPESDEGGGQSTETDSAPEMPAEEYGSLSSEQAGHLINDTGVALSPARVEALVDGISAASAAGGEQNLVGSGYRTADETGLFLVWDEDADAPQVSDSGGNLIGVTRDPSGRFGVVRDTRLNLRRIWDFETGQPFAAVDGTPGYLEPSTALNLVMPSDYLSLWQSSALGVIAFAHAASREEQRIAILGLEDLRRTLGNRSSVYGPFVQWLDEALQRINAVHTDPAAFDANGALAADISTGLETWALSALSPSYMGSVIGAQAQNDLASRHDVYGSLARTTGISARFGDSDDDVTFIDPAGRPFFYLTNRTAITFLTRSGGASALDILAQWHAGAISVDVAAGALFRLAPSSFTAEATYQDTRQMLVEFAQPSEDTDIDVKTRSTLMALALVDPHMIAPDDPVTREILMTLLELAPISGNIISAGYAVEDVREFFRALDEEEYGSAAFAAGLALFDTLGAIPIIGTLGRAASKSVRRLLENLPGANRRFLARTSTTRLAPNRQPDILDIQVLNGMSALQRRRFTLKLNQAVSEASEIFIARGLNTIMRTVQRRSSRTIPAGPRRGNITVHDIVLRPSKISYFLSGFAASVTDRVILEIKTGGSIISRNQRAYMNLVNSRVWSRFSHDVRWVKIEDIPIDILQGILTNKLRRYFSDGQILEIVGAMHRQLPDLRMIDLIDYLARVTAIGGREIQDQAM